MFAREAKLVQELKVTDCLCVHAQSNDKWSLGEGGNTLQPYF